MHKVHKMHHLRVSVIFADMLRSKACAVHAGHPSSMYSK
jgi:hypothetical protein